MGKALNHCEPMGVGAPEANQSCVLTAWICKNPTSTALRLLSETVPTLQRSGKGRRGVTETFG